MKNINLSNIKNAAKTLIKKYFFLITKDQAGGTSFATFGAMSPQGGYQNIYFGPDAIISNSNKVRFNTRKLVPDLLSKTGLIVIKEVELANTFREQVVIHPTFMELEICLPNTFDEYYKTLGGNALEDIRRIKKTGYTYSFSRDPAWVDKFFDDYYLPTMVGRHGNDAYIMPKHQILALIKEPHTEFLNVFNGDKCVASQLNRITDGKYSALRLGRLKDDTGLLDKGALTAVYWFLIQRAFELGCKTISLGGTPPYLENGVLKYKAKWQARFRPDIFVNENYLLIDPSNPACHQFLRNISLVVFGLKNSLIVLSSKLPGETKLPESILSELENWFLLRPKRTELYPMGMEELPEHLRYWYEKIQN